MKPNILFRIIALIFLVQSCSFKNKKIEGGYDFIDNIPSSDTNLYTCPIKDKLIGKDSVYQNFSHYDFEAFDEPNISLQKSNEPIFRLEYQTAFGFPHVMITLVKEKLIIKEAIDGIPSKKIIDDSLFNLSNTEKVHFKLLRRKYPLTNYIKNYANWHPKKQYYFDSIIKASPELLNPKYFKNLLEKALIDNPEKFNYKIKEIKLSSKDYITLVDSINTSGYWKLPIYLPKKTSGNHGYGYSLEANAYGKYNIVYGNCWDTIIVPYLRSLQQIINKSNLSKDIDVLDTLNETNEKPNPIVIQDLSIENIILPKKAKKNKK